MYPQHIMLNSTRNPYSPAQTAMFTGRRAFKLGFEPGSLQFDEALMCIDICIERAIEYGYLNFYTGMANGFDLMAAARCADMRNKNTAIRITGVIPHEGHARGWNDYWKRAYINALDRLDETIVLAPHYSRGCFYARNKYMVERSTLVIAGLFGGGAGGGTGQTLRLARRKGADIIEIF